MKLFKFIYKGHMLYLWLWYPDYSRAAARALCCLLKIENSAAPDLSDIKDKFMLKQFQESMSDVCKLWEQYKMQDAEISDIVKMSHTDNTGKTQEDLSRAYPNYKSVYFV